MTELINFTAIRGAQSLTPKEIDKVGIITHPTNFQSERYRGWLDLCERKQYEELSKEMLGFLQGKDAIRMFDQISSAIVPVLKFAEYNGFRSFNLKEFVKQVDLRKLSNDFGKRIKDEGCYNEESRFFQLITNLNDQLLATTQFNVGVKREFDLQGTIKTLKLIEAVYLVGKEKIQLNINKHYDKPIIIDSCILEIESCSLVPSKPILDDDPIKDNLKKSNTDTGCRCKEESGNECECKCNEDCVKQNPCCVTITPYVSELFVVRDDVCKYEPGEISYIKNIVKGETQERIHRNLEQETVFTESIEEIKKYEEKFLEVTDKSSVSKTIEDIIKDETKVHAGAYYGKGSKENPNGLFVEGTFDFKRNRDRTNKIIRDKSKDIVSRLTSRLEKNITNTTRQTLHKESEITNTSKLTGTDSDISRQFYSVKQVRKAQVYSYGMRTMLDFYLPEPAELLKRLVEKQFDLKKPEKQCINIEEIGTTKDD